ncbi:MAG: DUF4145 domain-containing protein, partial [Spirochaetia bacterium]|nr:DUF4145 domain-containing protein [Spirochaetia bacterium]
MTNFDFLLNIPQFSPFADVAISAERIYRIDVGQSVVACRRALEFAVKWMYSADRALEMPYQDSLVSLINTAEFHDIVPSDVWKRVDFIRKIGNVAAHSSKKVTPDQAALCLENLYAFIDFLAYSYIPDYKSGSY